MKIPDQRSLLAKLGYFPGQSVLLSSSPKWFRTLLLKNNINIKSELPADWAHLFISNQKELDVSIETIDLVKISNALWLSWPKKSSGLKSDISEHSFRHKILPLGWVDIKVVSIDDTWSGLKFSRRIK